MRLAELVSHIHKPKVTFPDPGDKFRNFRGRSFEFCSSKYSIAQTTTALLVFNQGSRIMSHWQALQFTKQRKKSQGQKRKTERKPGVKMKTPAQIRTAGKGNLEHVARGAKPFEVTCSGCGNKSKRVARRDKVFSFSFSLWPWVLARSSLLSSCLSGKMDKFRTCLVVLCLWENHAWKETSSRWSQPIFPADHDSEVDQVFWSKCEKKKIGWGRYSLLKIVYNIGSQCTTILTVLPHFISSREVKNR